MPRPMTTVPTANEHTVDVKTTSRTDDERCSGDTYGLRRWQSARSSRWGSWWYRHCRSNRTCYRSVPRRVERKSVSESRTVDEQPEQLAHRVALAKRAGHHLV